jgi:exonuclease III
LGVGRGANNPIPEKTPVTETEVKQNWMEPLLMTFGTKQKMKIGFWNVRTLRESSKLKQVIKEMNNYKMDILGLSEVRWPEFGEMQTKEGITFLYSGQTGDNAEHREGVVLLLNKVAKKSLVEWQPISQRVMTVSFKTKIQNVTIIQCYAPTENAENERKEHFYYILKETVRKIWKKNVIIIMGDLNTKIGSNNVGPEQVMGVQGVGEMNENVEMFANFCANYDLVIGGTLFPHKTCHKITWVSFDHSTENHIDCIALSRKFRRSLTDVRNK